MYVHVQCYIILPNGVSSLLCRGHTCVHTLYTLYIDHGLLIIIVIILTLQTVLSANCNYTHVAIVLIMITL